jgi:hypothetical protein
MHNVFLTLLSTSGGYEEVNKKDSWAEIAKGLNMNESAVDTLTKGYKVILYPYELFEDGKSLSHLVSFILLFVTIFSNCRKSRNNDLLYSSFRI